MGLTYVKHALAFLALFAFPAAARPQTPRQAISVPQRMIVLESDGSSLRVNELYKVQNAMPEGAAVQRRLEIYLPEGAAVKQATARSNEGKSVKIAVVPLKEKNRYAFAYPLRPGQTQFTVAYELPYGGQLVINPRVTAVTAQLMVVAPDSMRLVPANNSALLPADDPQLKNVSVYVASNLAPQSNLGLEVQGSGILGRSQKQGSQTPTGKAPPEARPSGDGAAAREQGGKGGASAQWIFLIVLLLFLAAGATYVYSVHHATPPPSPAPADSSLLAEMKEEMFQLESDRLQGKLSPEEYEAAKAALDRAMQKIL
jgi:hypothetical protein